MVSLVSGDLTRRKKPGAAFRRAKAKLVAMGMVGKEMLEGSEDSSDDDDNGGIEAGVVSSSRRSKRGKKSKRKASSSRERQPSKLTEASKDKDDKDNKDTDETGVDDHEEKVTDDAGTRGGIFADLPTRFPTLHVSRLSRVVEEMSQLSQSSRSNSRRGSWLGGSREGSLKDFVVDGREETTVDQPDSISLVPPAPAADGPAVISSSTGAGTGHRDRRDQSADITFSALIMSAAADAGDEESTGRNRSEGQGKTSRVAQAGPIAPDASSSDTATRGGAAIITDSAISPKMRTATGKLRAESRAGGADYTSTSDEGSTPAAVARQRPTKVQTAGSTSHMTTVEKAKHNLRASRGGAQGSSRGRATASSASKRHSRRKGSSKKSHDNGAMDSDWSEPLDKVG